MNNDLHMEDVNPPLDVEWEFVTFGTLVYSQRVQKEEASALCFLRH